MGGRLKILGAVLRLLTRSPMLFIRLGGSARRFRAGFEAGAQAEGLPPEAARALARELRPMDMLNQARRDDGRFFEKKLGKKL